jgi:hypothetical protein
MDNMVHISVAEDGLTLASYLTFMIDEVLTDPEYIHTPSGNNTWSTTYPSAQILQSMATFPTTGNPD